MSEIPMVRDSHDLDLVKLERAEAAPDGTECSLSSSGHVDTAGTGSCSVSLSFYPPAASA